MHSIFLEYIRDWLHPNGLGKFNKDEKIVNDNGILINADMLDQLDRMGRPDEIEAMREVFMNTAMSLQHKDHLGLQHRTPEDTKRFDQQDNPLGIILGESILQKPFLTKHIYDYGCTHGFNYNNVSPSEWNILCQRQPGEVAFYAIANGYIPEPSQFALFIAGLTTNAFFTKGSSDSLLAHRRIVVVETIGIKHMDFQNAFDTAKAVWKQKFKSRYRTMYQMYLEFYGEFHPITRLAHEFDM